MARPTEREAVFHPEFRDDLKDWVESDRKVALRVLDLVEAVMRDPFTGIGKPEPLKFALSGLKRAAATVGCRVTINVGRHARPASQLDNLYRNTVRS